MALDIKKVEYFNITVGDHAGEGSKLLALFAATGINLLAFKAIPLESNHTLFTLFPDDSSIMAKVVINKGIKLDGPHPALLIQGDDQSGALADIYEKLSRANITVNESSGIADINGAYGVVLYLSKEDCKKAMAVLYR